MKEMHSMKKTTTISSRLGTVDVFISSDKRTVYAIPNGYISPSLVIKDLAYLKEFDSASKVKWKYIVDTSRVKVAHPINPFFLRRIKQFSMMSEYVVYAPSSMVRLLLKMSSWISNPDRVLISKDQLENELRQ